MYFAVRFVTFVAAPQNLLAVGAGSWKAFPLMPWVPAIITDRVYPYGIDGVDRLFCIGYIVLVGGHGN